MQIKKVSLERNKQLGDLTDHKSQGRYYHNPSVHQKERSTQLSATVKNAQPVEELDHDRGSNSYTKG